MTGSSGKSVPEKIAFRLNGAGCAVEADPAKSLLKVLRNDLRLTGTKCGCDGGECGACAVLVDGERRLACSVPLAAVRGREVTTIEGLGSPGRLHPIQEAFVETGAIQCGFCTPGMIMTSKALLDRNPRPTLEEIKKSLAGNLCRCTGYIKIFEGVKLASRLLAGSVLPPAPSPEGDAVGKSFPILDAVEKAAGTARFGDDLFLPGMLHGKVVRSTQAHARIVAVHTEEASRLPGVRAVLTARDVPGPNLYGRFFKDQPVLCSDRVRCVGDPVALVLAETEELAEEAGRRVKVEYEGLPPMFGTEEALREKAPAIHAKGNICAEKKISVGDVQAGFEQSEVVLARSYRTHFAEHAYLEPEAGVGYLDEEGRVVAAAGSQSPHFTQEEIAYSLGLNKDRVRVIQTKTGGGYGGKHDTALHCLLGLAVLKTGYPVKIRFTRRESLAVSSKRHPFQMDLRMGVKRDGALVALQADYVANTGAYSGSGPGVFTRALLHANGPYHFPNLDVSVRGVFTNNPSACGMRGFGAPQVVLALESHLDQLALEIGMDPWEIRYRNAFTPDHILPTGHRIPGNVEIRRCLEAVKPYFDRWRQEAAEKNRGTEGERYGVGLATTMYGIGQSGILFPARVRVYMEGDGTLVVRAGVADVGQGALTGLVQIAAQGFGVPFDRVKIFSTDTLTEPDSGPTAASRQIFFTGRVICSALKKLKERMAEAGSQIFESRVEKMTVEGGSIFPDGDRKLSLPVSDFLRRARERGIDLEGEDIYNPGLTFYDHKTGKGQPYPAYTYAAQVVEVQVGREDGRIQVPRVAVGQDVGRVINPKLVEGQLEGSILMGIGWALQEKFIPGKTESFATYRIPRSPQAPEITMIMVETEEPGAPFGAKGVGEAAMVPTAPALLNAIFQATGRRFYEIPVDRKELARPGGNR